MFERYTESARRAIVEAQDEARALRHAYVGTEHLLLGLLVNDSSVASAVLARLGVELADVRERVARFVGRGEEAVTGQIAFTPRAKRVLELGLREALSHGHNFIGPEHILLGLAREWDTKDPGVAVRILEELRIDAALVRDTVLRTLSEPPPANPNLDRAAYVGAVESATPPLRRRCVEALTLYGATFICQLGDGHDEDEHVEHGDGWTMRWARA